MIPRRVTIGVSTKMYFGYAQTLDWARHIADATRSHPAITSGRVELFLLPSYPTLPSVIEIARSAGILVGAQDIAVEDSGPFTGEVSGTMLFELGAVLAEVGHAERRRLHGETSAIVNEKLRAAVRNKLIPVLCVGEARVGSQPETPIELLRESALSTCIRQIDSALANVDGAARVIVAYEPVWAIGAPEPAPAAHIAAVCSGLRRWLAKDHRVARTEVLYGGSAGPGLLDRIGDSVDGLFLGRFAHDPASLVAVLDEALSVALNAHPETSTSP